MIVFETIDYSMIDIVKNGPHVPIKEGDPAQEGQYQRRWSSRKHVHEFDDEEKCLFALNVRACITIGNSLLYYIYHFVQNYWSTKEMMDTLTVVYEGTGEVKAVKWYSLNRRYKTFFSKVMRCLLTYSIVLISWWNICVYLIWKRLETL